MKQKKPPLTKLSCRGDDAGTGLFADNFNTHNINTISDSKRQQTTTVDYKRLINGLVLTRFASLLRNTTCIMETMKENEIVLYQPNETIKLEVRIENDSVWLNQTQMSVLFGTGRQAITKHIKNIYACGELQKEATCSILELVRMEGSRNVTRQIEF